MKKNLQYSLSFTNVYNKFFPLIYSVVYNKIKDCDDTNDICQEIFTRFYVKFSQIDNYKNWLYNAMQLVLCEYFRKKKKKNKECQINDVTLEYNDNEDERLLGTEILDKLDKFKNKKGKVIFEMVVLQNNSFKKTANTLGITPRQAQYQLKAVRNYLQDFIRSKGINRPEDAF